ncbi:MAG: dinitrogenase iron-molybdenum cofactor biosynthesis protein, partial [Chloroflexi bacterium]|nr:dinitrogenase iron-molybdenum cofactor biosynthesis protein [Chloroflexota bacterium]
MKIAISADGPNLEAQASPIFGRTASFILVDTDTLAWEALDNAAIGAAGGAGIQSAQFVIQRGAQAVVSGSVGPNAFQLFRA